jgi:hypothetical protein
MTLLAVMHWALQMTMLAAMTLFAAMHWVLQMPIAEACHVAVQRRAVTKEAAGVQDQAAKKGEDEEEEEWE